MAFHIGNETAERLVGVSGREVFLVAAHYRAVGVVAISPELHTCLSQFLLFAAVREMLKNHHGIRVCAVHSVVVVLEYGDTGCVVGTPFAHIVSGIGLGQTL